MNRDSDSPVPEGFTCDLCGDDFAAAAAADLTDHLRRQHLLDVDES